MPEDEKQRKKYQMKEYRKNQSNNMYKKIKNQ